MTYEIGQKVETPLGVGEVIDVFTREDKTISECKVCIKTYSVWFGVDDLKPYKTAHEKLIKMGFTATLEFDKYPIYRNNFGLELSFNPIEKTYYLTKWEESTKVSLELSRILTQYLEEMAE